MSHVDLDRVADLDGGVLPPEQERAVRGHLESCDQCSQLLERVREVHTLLGAEPAPQLPPSVAARLDDSLAAAVREREVRTGVTSLNRAKSRRQSWAPRVLAAAVGLAVVGGGAYVAQNVLGSNMNNTTSTHAVAGRNPGAGAARQPEIAVPSHLRLTHDTLKSQLYSALSGKSIPLKDLKNGPTAATSLDRVAGGCVSSALGAQTPANWMSYRVTFDSRPAVLVLSRAGIASTKVWVVECQPSPTVSASTVIPDR
jgi:anti-sigma factor RsiW